MSARETLDLAALDLNLLLSLDALLETVSVTKAAQRVNLTQSAMSHALRRLRDLFGDELLVRNRGAMVLTPRAEALKIPLRRALLELQRVVREPPEFVPGTSRRMFTIAANDFIQLLFLPRLATSMREHAPFAQLVTRQFEARRYAEQLDGGDIELAVGAFFDEAPGLVRQVVSVEELACAVAHRPRRKRLTIEDFTNMSHILLSPRGEGPSIVDSALESMGMRRRIRMRVSNFLVALCLVRDSDDILCAPRRMLAAFAGVAGVDVLDPPLPLPSFQVSQVWHERDQRDPAHQWLRQVIKDAFEAPAAD